MTEGVTKGTCPVILDERGQNYFVWKEIVAVYLSNEDNVWEVVQGKLLPPDIPEKTTPTEDQQKLKDKYNAANRRARVILFGSINPNLTATIFHGATMEVRGNEIWDELQRRYAKQSGALKDAAMIKFTTFKFSQNRTIEENLLQFTRVIQKAAEVGVTIAGDLQCSRLLAALPRDWDTFVMSWATKDEDQKHIGTLTEMIRGEAIRRQSDGGVDNAIALFTQMKFSGRGPRGRGRGRGRIEKTIRKTVGSTQRHGHDKIHQFQVFSKSHHRREFDTIHKNYTQGQRGRRDYRR